MDPKKRVNAFWLEWSGVKLAGPRQEIRQRQGWTLIASGCLMMGVAVTATDLVTQYLCGFSAVVSVATGIARMKGVWQQ